MTDFLPPNVDTLNGIGLFELSGAQVLPDVRDQRATITGWQAYCATNADLRSKSPIYYDLARRLFIRRGES